MRLTFLTIALTVSLLAALASSSAAETLIVGGSSLPPWNTNANGQPEGADVEIIKALAASLGLDVEFRFEPFKRLLENMKSGEIDMMAGLLRRPDREEYIYFIDPPYKTKSNKAFFVLKGKEDSISSYADLAGKTIGIRTETIYFEPFDSDASILKEAVPDNDSNIRKLLAGRIDAFLITDATGDYYVAKEGAQDKIVKARYMYNENNPVFMGFSKKSKLIDKKDAIVSALSQMINNGEVDKIIRNYFSSNGLPLPDYK